MKEYIELNNGVKIPSIGFGTWQITDEKEVRHSIKTAIKKGYRHIDTAAIYKNEKSVGKGIKECGVARKDLFITSKVWNTERGYENTIAAFKKSLKDLQLQYLDLYLIHWPATAHQHDNWQELNNATWSALENLYSEGKIKAIGVSNFLQYHLEPLLERATIMPAVNQIEYHPGFKQQDCVNYCQENNIQIEGWSPLGRSKVLDNKLLKEIARKYNKSVAQLSLRWAIQNKIIPLPKSATPNRIEENFDVFDFTISVEDMKSIQQIKVFGNSGFDPDEVDF
jgi:diketogulonate reductase-like aldo/keto reductase